MRKTLVNVIVVLPMLAAAFLLGVRYADCTKKASGGCYTHGSESSSCLWTPTFSKTRMPTIPSELGSCFDSPSNKTRDLLRIDGYDDQLRYPFAWDNQNERILYLGRPIKSQQPQNDWLALNTSYLDFYPQRYPSPWEATLPGCNTINTRQSRIR